MRERYQDTWFDECVVRLYTAGRGARGPDGPLLQSAALTLMRTGDAMRREAALGILDELLGEMAHSGALSVDAVCELRLLVASLAAGGGCLEPIATH